MFTVKTGSDSSFDLVVEIMEGNKTAGSAEVNRISINWSRVFPESLPNKNFLPEVYKHGGVPEKAIQALLDENSQMLREEIMKIEGQIKIHFYQRLPESFTLQARISAAVQGWQEKPLSFTPYKKIIP